MKLKHIRKGLVAAAASLLFAAMTPVLAGPGTGGTGTGEDGGIIAALMAIFGR